MANTKITTSVISADAITGALIADDVALGGNPTTTTQSAGNDTTRVATTAFVTAAIDNLIDSAPGTMNTLNEIAAAINDDANFNTTVTNLIAARLPLAGGTMTGNLAITAHDPKITITDNTSSTRAWSISVGASADNAFEIIDVTGSSTLLKSTPGSKTVLRPDGNEFHMDSSAGNWFKAYESSNNLHIQNKIQDGDIIIGGMDSSSAITALTLDMSNAGYATFNSGFTTGSGNVGIGDSSPIAKLTVKAASDTIRAESLATDAKNITMSYHDSNDQGQIFCGQDGVVDKNIVLRGHTLIFQRNGGTEAMRIDSSGEVGIGTAAPNYPLDVYGTADLQMRIHRPSSSLGLNDTCGIGFSQRGDTNTSTSDTRAAIVSTYNGSLHLCTEPGGNLNSNPVDHSALSIIGTAQSVHIGNTTTGFHSSVLPLIVGSGSGDEGMTIFSGSSNKGKIGFADAATDDSGSYRGYFQYDHNDDSLRIGTAGSERVRIASDGKVGVTAVLTAGSNAINGTTAISGELLRLDSAGDNTPVISMVQSNARLASIGAYYSSQAASYIFLAPPEGSLDRTANKVFQFHGDGKIKTRCDNGTLYEWFTPVASNAMFAFGGVSPTATSGTGNIHSLHMIQSGKITWGDWTDANALGVCEGTWNQEGTDRDYISFHHRNSMNWYGNSNGQTLSMATGGGMSIKGSLTQNQFSDMRLKKDIVPLESVLDKVNSLDVFNFNYMNPDTGEIDQERNRDTGQIGLSAQQTEELFPQVVEDRERIEGDNTVDNRNWKYLEYEKMTPILVKAVQELSEKLDAAEARIATLEG